MTLCINDHIVALRALCHSQPESDRRHGATLAWLYEEDGADEAVNDYVEICLGLDWREQYPLTCQAVADLAVHLLIFRTRENGEVFVMFNDNDTVPECLRDALVPVTEGDDFRYKVLHDAVESLAELEDHEWDDVPYLEPDIYNKDLCAWLNGKQDYVNEAMLSFGPAADIMGMIQQGQFLEKQEVMLETIDAIRQLVEAATSLYP